MAKMTKKEMFNEIAVVVTACETIENEKRELLLDFVAHEVELLEKKRSSGKMSKTQEENEKIKEMILGTLDTDGAVTITEMQTLNTELAGYANQKLSALMRQLVLEKKVVKTVDKKKSFFSLAEETE